MIENMMIALSVCGVYGLLATAAITAANYLANMIRF